MRERLYRVIHALEKRGWKDFGEDSLVTHLRFIAENEDLENIKEIFEAFDDDGVY